MNSIYLPQNLITPEALAVTPIPETSGNLTSTLYNNSENDSIISGGLSTYL